MDGALAPGTHMRDGRELKAAGASAAVVAVYTALVLLSGRVDIGDYGRLLSVYLAGSFFLWACLGFLIGMVQLVRQARRSGRDPFLLALVEGFVRERWRRDRFVSLFWPPLLFPVLMASFNAFKQMVLPLAGFGADPALAAFDRMLFLGQDPWRVTHALFGSPEATLLIDRAYHGWFLPMAVGIVLCAWLPAASYRLRTQYVMSYLAVWIGIGSLLALLVPSAGPCFYSQLVGSSPSFDALLERLAHAQQVTGAELNALSNQAWLMEALGGEELMIGGGISAMPSVHCALAALFALAAFRLNRLAGYCLAGYALLIWIGSIHLGWHYATDGLVASALVLAIWPLSGRIADALDRPKSIPAPRPALA